MIALGMDFILQNIGLQIGRLANSERPDNKDIQWLAVLGNQAATPTSFPQVLEPVNILEPIFGPDVPLRILPSEVMVIVTAVILVFALTWFIANTRSGKAMRAVAQNPAAAAMMGIDVDRIINLTYAIGGALAGGAAVMYGLYKGQTSFDVGFVNGLYSFTAAVVGGIGNIRGAALGALMIGVISALSNQLLTSSDWSKALVFLILVLVLVFKPTGLLGSDGGEKA
jgi:branched-chain amino acid transport system permease protein